MVDMGPGMEEEDVKKCMECVKLVWALCLWLLECWGITYRLVLCALIRYAAEQWGVVANIGELSLCVLVCVCASVCASVSDYKTQLP